MDRPKAESPTRAVVRQNFMVAGAAAVFGLAGAVYGLWSLAALCLALAALFCWSAFVTQRSFVGAETLNRAWDATSRGRLAEAQALLDRTAGTYQLAYIRQAIDLCLARVAYRRGDLPAALERATAAADRGPRWVGASYARTNRVAARALRALVRAAMGDAAGAREDAAFVRGAAEAAPDALARAELAEALLLEKGGDREALGAHLARHAPLLSESTTPRERAIVRAYERLLKARRGSVYRERAPAEREPEESNEPGVEDWVSTVAPGAAPFVRVGRAGSAGAPRKAEPVDRALQRGVAARLAATKPRPAWRRVLILWVLLIAMFLAIWQFLTPSASPHQAHAAPPPDPVEMGAFAAWWLPAVFLAVFGGVLTYALVLARREPRRLVAAMRRAAEGARDEADRAIEALTKSRLPVVKAQAYLHLADSAERRASFAEALERCDRGLEAVASTHVARAVASTAVTPGLLSERAVILAALGREAEASAEMAHLADAFPNYPLRAWAERRFEILARARSGDFAGAADVAASDACDAPMPARDELLGDLARAGARPEAASAEEVARLQRVLREDAGGRAWIEAVAPGVLDAFASRGRREGEEAVAEAEREAQAEEAAALPVAEARR